MSSKINRRDFLKWTGAATLVASCQPVGISQEAASNGGALAGTDFATMCGLPDPLVAEFPMPNGKTYPYIDDAGELIFHEHIRELPDPEISRTPLTEPVDLLANMPERLESENGLLDVEIEAVYGTKVINGQELSIRSYNGGSPGPTLVIQPGDVMRIRHANNLPPNPVEGPHHNINHPHGFNDINLHTHGFNGNPGDNEDNALLVIQPGETFEYEHFIEETHPTGTYWYHPHKHGATANHVASGMAGFLLMVDPENDIRSIPEIGAAKEVTLMIQEFFIQDNEDGTGYVPDWPAPIMEFYYGPEIRVETTVNGFACNEIQENGDVVIPEIRMRPGEVQHWRVSHAGIFFNWIMGIEEHDMHIVAYDGLTSDEVHTMEEFSFTSGQRRDIMVKASMKPGTYAVKRKAYKQAQQVNTWPEKTLFNIVVSGEPMDMALPTKLNPPSDVLPYIAEEEIVAERKVTMQFIDNTEQNILLFLINKRVFDPGYVNYSVALNTAERWHVCNGLSSDHPFHMHVNWVELHKVVDKDGNETVYDPPIWMDTFNVPRGGYATVQFRTDNYQGLSVLHCHILTHEDEGMMSLVEIVDGAPKTEIITAEGGLFVSPEYNNRVHVHFLEHCVEADTEVTYEYSSSAKAPTINVAPEVGDELGEYDRFFNLTAQQDGNEMTELNRAATITVNYSPGQEPRYVPASQIKLYHYDEEQQAWTTDGISVVSRTPGVISCSTRKLGKFAVLGKIEPCYDVVGHDGINEADIEYIQSFVGSPYEYFIDPLDFNKDGRVDQTDVQFIIDEQGNYCPI